MQDQHNRIISETWILALFALLLLCITPMPGGEGGPLGLLFILLIAGIGLGIKHLFVKRFLGGAPHRWGSLLLAGFCESLLILLLTEVLWGYPGLFKPKVGIPVGCLTVLVLVAIATTYPHWRFISGECERVGILVEKSRTLTYAVLISLATPVLFVAIVLPFGK